MSYVMPYGNRRTFLRKRFRMAVCKRSGRSAFQSVRWSPPGYVIFELLLKDFYAFNSGTAAGVYREARSSGRMPSGRSRKRR